MEKADLGGLLAGIAAIAAVIGAWWRWLPTYEQKERWNRAAFLSNEMRLFLDDPEVRVALTLLDWSKREVALQPTAQDWEHMDHQVVTSTMTCHALRSHRGKRSRYSRAEARIRDLFDRMLDGLDRIWSQIDAGLFTAQDADNYIDYWIDAIVRYTPTGKDIDARAPTPLILCIRLIDHIEGYGWSGAKKLIHAISGVGLDAHRHALLEGLRAFRRATRRPES